MLCPNCRDAMTSLTLEGHYQRSVVIDICNRCQAFWFDGMESLQLEPASVLELFRLVGQAGAPGRTALSNSAKCPRCKAELARTFDQQRHSRFEYQRCPAGHGRLTSFFNFLREKDFIRPLSATQIEELRRNLRSVNCSNCGAPVDVEKGAACAHCGSQLSLVDMSNANAAAAALAQWLVDR
ncbi:MAG TPA: zf-TFIIB domain-containing protein [Vicinamibacterales bacterium]|nr:zf-TFIIB domain-containing protein [Vicinamibacterales bacterium]